MVKHTQTFRRQITDQLFECVWPFFVVVAPKVKWLTDFPNRYEITEMQTSLKIEIYDKIHLRFVFKTSDSTEFGCSDIWCKYQTHSVFS